MEKLIFYVLREKLCGRGLRDAIYRDVEDRDEYAVSDALDEYGAPGVFRRLFWVEKRNDKKESRQIDEPFLISSPGTAMKDDLVCIEYHDIAPVNEGCNRTSESAVYPPKLD